MTNFPISEKCIGCSHINGDVCSVYSNPENMWRVRTCLMATHVKQELKKDDKKRIGQQKQKKKK